MKKKSIFLLVFILLFTLTSCSKEDDLFDGGSKKDDQTELLSLTIEEVSAFDGKGGNLAYIVVQGVIYDVTDEWTNGEHNGVKAGSDATEAILGAPHSETVLEDLLIIGNIKETEDTSTYYTLEELAMYDGLDGSKGYIAVNGIIYDVTTAWNNGQHNGIMAGTDATAAFANSPHSEATLDTLVVIGKLSE